MAGAEGGVGGPPFPWKFFLLLMGGIMAVMIVGITIGEHFGWLH